MPRLPLIALLALATETAALLHAQPPAPPFTLATAIRAALENNQSIKVEAYAPAIAKANVLTALGAFDPALIFDRSYARDYAATGSGPQTLPSELTQTDNYAAGLGGLLPWGLTYSLGGTATNERGTFNNFTNDFATYGGVTLTQPLLRGFGLGANLVNVRIAKANHRINNWAYRQTVIDTVYNVVNGYTNLVLAHAELDIAIHNRALAQSLLDENVQELKIGYVARSEVTTARTQVAQREEAILLEQNTVRSDDNTLRQLMGQTSFPPDQPLLAVVEPEVPAVTVDPLKDLQVALNRRPDYQQARLTITINRASDSAAHNLLLPQVNLTAGYGYNGLDPSFAASRREVTNRQFPNTSIGVSVSVPLANAVGRGSARAARLTLEQSKENLALLEGTIAMDVANAASQIETARRRVIADRAAYALASRSLDDENKKLRDGTSSTLLVIQSQSILIGAESSVPVAVTAEIQAVANYEHTLGTTLDRYHIDLADK